MEAEGQRGVTPGLALAALYVLGVFVYAVLGHRIPMPSISPDEFTYGHLARAVADGEGLTWRGESVPLRAALYIYAIAPAWLGSSTTAAYAITKLIGAALCALVVVPTWLLARRSLGQWLALAPAAMALAGTWMLVTSGVLTENLAYPLGVAALSAIVAAVQRPRSSWPWIALGLIAVAALSRSQLGVLLVVLPLAAVVDAMRYGRAGLRDGLARQRRTLAAGGAIALVGVIAAVASPHTMLGAYAGVQDYAPSLESVLTSAGRHAVGLAAMAGLLPAVVIVTLTALRGAWEDDDLGPMLAVFWAATVVLTLEVAWYIAGTGFAWHVERYLMYLVPLGCTIAIAGIARVRPDWRVLLGVSVALGALLLLAAPMRNVTEEEGVFGVFRPMHALFGTSAAQSLALTTVLLGLACAGLLRRGAGGGPKAITVSIAALTLAVFVVQDAAAWSWRIGAVREVRADRPTDLRWLDRAAGGPIGRMLLAANPPGASLTEFFNRDIAQTYVPAPAIGGVGGRVIHGRTCPWTISTAGVVSFDTGCGTAPKRFLLDEEIAKLTFAGQRIVTNEPKGGRVVDIAGGSPRLLALVFVPCGPAQFHIVLGDDGAPRTAGRSATCTPGIHGNLWLDRPATLEVKFRGGQVEQRIAAGGRISLIPPARVTTVRVPAPGRPTSFNFQLDWTGTGPAFPTLEGVDLVRGNERIDIMGAARD